MGSLSEDLAQLRRSVHLEVHLADLIQEAQLRCPRGRTSLSWLY